MGCVECAYNKEKERLDSRLLLVAVNRGEPERVKEIIEGMKTNGVDINHQGDYGYTALMIACSKGHTKVALELLKVGGLNVNIQNRYGWTASI